MCLVIDLNVLPSVLNENSKNHQEYKPVLSWIIKGKGKIIYGGKRYKQELGRLYKYLQIFVELDKKGKIIKLNDNRVDDKELELIKNVNKKDFNDAHIIAIIIISKCKLLCSEDKHSFVYIKNKEFYSRKLRPPKIYTGKRNIDLLCDANIVSICK